MSLNSEQRILVDAYKTALNGKDVQGRELKVSEAKPMAPKTTSKRW